jgi:hypothetical protein
MMTIDNPWNFKTGSLDDIDLADRPHSRWRTRFGYVAVMVIDEGAPRQVLDTPSGITVGWEITKTHYEWQWKPFRNRR